MANNNPFSSDANRFRSPTYLPRCKWPGCHGQPFMDTPVCLHHACVIADVVNDAYLSTADLITRPPQGYEPPERPPLPQPYVYYLMLSPVTVKIGTTRYLARRIRELRTELQYVVAIERGGIELERQRHREFADERRHKLREDFYLSDRLKAHIDTLAAQRDELMAAAA